MTGPAKRTFKKCTNCGAQLFLSQEKCHRCGIEQRSHLAESFGTISAVVLIFTFAVLLSLF